MSGPPATTMEARGSLLAALAEIRARLEGRLARSPRRSAPRPRRRTPAARPAEPAAPAEFDPLAVLVSRFTLSNFERDVVVLCAGVELDSSFAALVAEAQGGDGLAGPTFGLALAALPDPHWSALTPAAALRRWRLIDLIPGAGVTGGLLRIDERVLHYLVGITYFEPRLQGLVEPVVSVPELSPSQVSPARAIVEAWGNETDLATKPVIALEGSDLSAHLAVAGTAAGTLGLRLHRLPAGAIPATAEERVTLARLWEREAMLLRSALLIVLGTDDGEGLQERARSFMNELTGLTLISSTNRHEVRNRGVLALAVGRSGATDQLALWRRELGPAAPPLNGAVERVAAQFQLDPPEIRRAAREALAEPGGALETRLWNACRRQARPALDQLAQGIEPLATWDDLVLPAAQKQVLRTIVAQVRQRAKVCEAWGFARKSARGLGFQALFSGPSGTGKTMAAEVIARELELDLYRIDLSALVSKYIGETEKNLRRVFDAAERGASILLFDEADALFGKRSEVRDSHDRYANIEVSYLLQRLESYRGLAILTTNQKAALDPAFARRLRFAVHFPFPDQAARREIWRRIFPAETPTAGIDCEKLSRLSVSGGHIRNIALNAAFLAADASAPVQMGHLLASAQAEYAKLEKQLNETEVGGWL